MRFPRIHSSHLLSYSLFFICMLAVTGLPSPSYAQGLSIDQCTGGAGNQWDYTSRVVLCIVGSIYQATIEFARQLAGYMVPIVKAMLTLAIAWLGIQVVGGERQTVQKGIILCIKLGAIILIYGNIDLLVRSVFILLYGILTIINGGYTPWGHLDILLGKLVGIGPTLILSQGLIGIIGATLLSSTTGIFLFMAGFMGLLDLLLLMFTIVFTYLSAITLICFMLALSPFFVPMVLFYQTERYFTKWVNIIFSGMLVPILMITFCYYFLRIFNERIADIFMTLGFPCSNPYDFTTCIAPDFREHWKLNQPLFSWLMPADPSLSQKMQDVTKVNQLSDPAVQSNINPLLRRGFNNNMMNVPGVHFGPNNVAIIEKLMFQFISLWIFASLFKSVIRKIPNIADDIAGALNRITMEQTQIESTIRRTFRMKPEEMKETAGNISEKLKDNINRMRGMATGNRSQRRQ